MGIFLSLLFPRLYMPADNTRSSASSLSSRSSSPRPAVPMSDVRRSSSLELPPPPAPQNPAAESPPPESTRYTPHGVGLGIISPQPIVGPFAPATRAPMASPQRRSSPLRQRSSSLGSGAPHSPLELPPRVSFDEAQPPPVSPGLAYIFPVSPRDTADPMGAPLSPSSTTSPASGMRIAIPPPNATASTSTPSPPLLPPPAADPLPPTAASTAAGTPLLPLGQQQPMASAYFSSEETAYPMQDPSASDAHLDFTEFDADADGLTALEKIYLFSRSQAAFHRVFIVHALPKYLGADDVESGVFASREEIEHITPAEAVVYVLPLLNSLALDEDEAVKEALAAELMSIIWWYITNCRIVDDSYGAQPTDDQSYADQPTESAPQEADVATISVQAFTPILGTLLLSQNGLVNASARHAVVELLKRIRRADEREAGNPPAPPADGEEPARDYEVGLLGSHERCLFEREMLHQVVIGMGRLDMPDADEGLLSNISTPRSVSGAHAEPHIHEHHRSGSHDLAYPVLQTPPATAPDSSTAGSTPLAPPPGMVDSYFPSVPVQSPSSDPPGAGHNDHSAVHSFALSPAFTLAQPPRSPLSQVTNAEDFFSVSHSAPSPAMTLPSPTPSLPANTSATLPLADVVQPLGHAGPSASSSSDSNISTPSLTSPSSSASSSSLESPNTGGAATSSSQRVAPIVSTSSTISGSSMSEGMDVEMGYDNEGSVSERPRVRGNGLTLDLSESREQAALSLSETALHTAIQGIQGDTASAPVSAWLDAGLLEGDVDMEDVSNAGQDQGEGDNEGDISEEAAVGRLSSMSLMAAVTASGTLREEAKSAFVGEVERVGRDPVYWVRREAAFAVGALAKVVPDELVIASLLPLFQSLYQDPTWHVRHSVLFALPAILARLPPQGRRELALDVMLPLSMDDTPTVRSAVLEALGEVMHTFANDEGGPPRELLNMFLGVRENAAERASPQGAASGRSPSNPPGSGPASESGRSDLSGTDSARDVDIYEDPARPLVCAFNIPAAALTLGGARWPELRDLYRTLSQSPSFKVRRTLAASLGEMARIVGPGYAKDDLLEVWRASIGAEETEVRLKAVECAAAFVGALGLDERAGVLRGLGEEFSSGRLRGWREREEVIKSLPSFLDITGVEKDVLRRLLMEALGDRVSAIREAAVTVLPAFVKAWRHTPHLMEGLQEGIRALALSDCYRERTTFVTCEQALLLSDDRDVVMLNEDFWETMSTLARDSIVDVRIRVARLLGVIADFYADTNSSMLSRLLSISDTLEQDTSHDVRAFAHSIRSRGAKAQLVGPPKALQSAVTFSRPPPPTPS
ncbi:hypothetical protein WOLCODRAFT_136056 [Wolfiporia cocos MD-104 SS10]|uniref:ARM repeat-containing protein n=1 Tax=Wolfiporia cocos (strain MD-104) TaxID=742152 RepID=A0A2H3JNA8_WOLCO|nr:hypothetical protein WOLCODRAFT_136056 [Wolfiporia cocos MD-104 SS10]